MSQSHCTNFFINWDFKKLLQSSFLIIQDEEDYIRDVVIPLEKDIFIKNKIIYKFLLILFFYSV